MFGNSFSHKKEEMIMWSQCDSNLWAFSESFCFWLYRLDSSHTGFLSLFTVFFNDFIVFRVICHPVMMISCLSADILNIPFASICVHLKSIFTSIQFLFCFLLICSCSAFNCIHFSSLPSAVSGHISLVCLPVFTIAQSFFYLFL